MQLQQRMSRLTTIYHEHPRAVLFTAAATLRFLLTLCFPVVPELISLRAEVATPVNGWKRLQEGLFLYERGLDPYDGGIFHQAPLLLPLFSLLQVSDRTLNQLCSVLFFTLLDLNSANCLFVIASSGAATKSSSYRSSRSTRSWVPSSVAAVYLLNPFTLAACFGRPTTVITATLTLLSIQHACEAKTVTSAFALALASYMSLHPLLLIPPICLLCYDQLSTTQAVSASAEGEKAKANVINALPDKRIFVVQFVSLVVFFTVLLLTLSRLFLPSWRFLASVYLTPLTLPDLTPNPGLWWYFFIEMFDAFRGFFLGVFWLHMFSYSVPFCLRLRRQPLAAVVSMMGIVAVFQPYANVGDAGVWLSCLALFGHVMEVSSRHRYSFPAIATLLYATLLGPAFHYLWIYAGSGNANFFYAITLVWSLALLVLLTDFVYAVLRDEWEAERPEGKGQEIRQI